MVVIGSIPEVRNPFLNHTNHRTPVRTGPKQGNTERTENTGYRHSSVREHVLCEESLIVPHERMIHRQFALVPLLELLPECTEPGTGIPYSDILEKYPIRESRKWGIFMDIDAAATFRVNDFEGPLDLLLFLIKKNEVNIYDIPIASITEQYLAYLDYSVSGDLASLTDFYALAATLLYIKSRMLLPVEIAVDDEDIDDPRKELVDKLIEYQKFKKLSELMEQKEDEAEWVFERKKIQSPLPFADDDELWERLDTWDLLKTFSNLVSSYNSERILDMYEEVSVNEKITLMNELLETRGECMFTDLIVRKGNLMDIVCAFMALLEAVKFRMASIWQNRMFGDIKIKPWKKISVDEMELTVEG